MLGLLETLETWAKSENSNILFLLACIVGLMGFDFLTGYCAAWKLKKVTSNIGILGLMRKLISVLLLVIFIPLMALLPHEVGATALYGSYVAYLIFELSSIIENLDKLGVPVAHIKNLFGLLQQLQPQQEKKEGNE